MHKRLLPFSFGWLSEFRIELMGICAIGIILCHTGIHDVSLPVVVQYLFSFGNQGVDVFLILSGIGMWYSLRNTCRLGKWYKKRFISIGVPYVLICGLFYIWYTVKNEGNILFYVYHLSTIGFWIDNFGAWYIALLVPLYLLVPGIAKIIDRSKNRFMTVIVMILTITLICTTGKNLTESTVHNFCSRFMYVRSFVLGYGIAVCVDEKKTCNWLYLLISAVAAFVATNVLNPNLQLYSLYAIPLAMMGCGFVYLFRNSIICRMLQWMGERSLESYLACGFLPFILRELPIWSAAWNRGNYIFYLVVIVFGLLLTDIFHRVSRLIIKQIL